MRVKGVAPKERGCGPQGEGGVPQGEGGASVFDFQDRVLSLLKIFQ